MAAPNIVNVANIVGQTSLLTVTTAAANIVTNSAASNKVYKINSLVVTNANASTTDITAQFTRSGANTKIAAAISVPTKSTLVILSKDLNLYLEEGDSLTLTASANSALEAVCSFEVIS